MLAERERSNGRFGWVGPRSSCSVDEAVVVVVEGTHLRLLVPSCSSPLQLTLLDRLIESRCVVYRSNDSHFEMGLSGLFAAPRVNRLDARSR